MDNYVSLLPPQYTQKLKKAETLRKATLAVIVAAALFFAAAAVSAAYRTAGQQKIISVQNEIEHLELQISQFSEIEVKQNELLELRNRIVSVQSRDPLLISAAADVISRIPSGVRIRSVSLSTNKDNARIGSVFCTGSTFNDVARFMNDLLKSEHIADVVCSDSKDYDGIIEFTLAITFVSPNETQENDNEPED